MTASGLLLGSLPLSSSAYAAGSDITKVALDGCGGSSRLMNSKHHYRYHYAEVQNVQNLPEPEGMRVPFNWPTMVVPPAGSHQWPLLTWHSGEDVRIFAQPGLFPDQPPPQLPLAPPAG